MNEERMKFLTVTVSAGVALALAISTRQCATDGCKASGRYDGAASRVAPKHVFFIGCDGLAAYTVTNAPAPTLRRLMAGGAWTLRSRSVLPSSSSPNWRSVFTCSATEQHGYVDGHATKPTIPPIERNERGLYPDVFSEFRKIRPDAEIGLFYEWAGIPSTLDTNACNRVSRAIWTKPNDLKRLCRYVVEKKPDFLAVCFNETDSAGHRYGWGSPEYNAVQLEFDNALAKIIEAAETAGIADETVFMVFSDHGGIDKVHYRANIPEMERPSVFFGKGVKKGHEFDFPGAIYDDGATLAALLGIVDPPASWIGRPRHDGFEAACTNALISVQPHLQLIGETSVGIAWMTRVEADGWVEWSQDDGATWRKAWNQRDGLRVEACDRIHRIVVTGYDPAKPLTYRVRSRACASFGQCKVVHSGEEGTYEGHINAVQPSDGSLSFAVFNDVHEQLETYPKMLGIREAASGLSLTVFNGDMVSSLVDDPESLARAILGPLAYCTAHTQAPVRYLRGNHDTRGAYARHLRDHLALQDDRYYGAVTLGRARLVFLDPGEDKVDDHVEYSGLVDFEGYLAEQTEWLKREVAGAAWRDAKFRVVFTHIPPDLRLANKENSVWKQPLPRIRALYDVFERAGTTLVISAHLHHRVLRPAGDLHPYALAAGGGKLNEKAARHEATLTRCDVLEDRIVVRQFLADGREIDRMEVRPQARENR